ncbi:MAG: CcdB family protein [Hyphomicrobiaceae bacterium]
MRQFDVHRNTNRRFRKHYPFLLILQHERFEDLSTVVVAPLVVVELGPAVSRLNPEFEIDGILTFLSISEPAAMSRKALGPHVTNLAERRDDIIAAVDFLITGF